MYYIVSIPVRLSVHNKESYEDMQIRLEAINYDKLKSQICGDLKVIDLLLVLQGFTASFVNGTAELGLFITQLRTGVPENPWNQESYMWKINH